MHLALSTGSEILNSAPQGFVTSVYKRNHCLSGPLPAYHRDHRIYSKNVYPLTIVNSF